MDASGPPKPRRGRPPRISRDDIINAVIEGTDEPTLAAVASKLGTTPQALYHHVSNHSEMLELVFRELTTRIDPPEPAHRSWEEYAFALGVHMHRIYSIVPGLADYMISTPAKERKLFERWEWLQEVGAEEGFDPLSNFWATRMVAEFVHSWVAREHRRELGRKEGAPQENEIFAQLSAKEGKPMPLTAQGFELEAQTSRSRFEFMLRALVHGLALGGRPEISLPIS